MESADGERSDRRCWGRYICGTNNVGSLRRVTASFLVAPPTRSQLPSSPLRTRYQLPSSPVFTPVFVHPTSSTFRNSGRFAPRPPRTNTPALSRDRVFQWSERVAALPVHPNRPPQPSTHPHHDIPWVAMDRPPGLHAHV